MHGTSTDEKKAFARKPGYVVACSDLHIGHLISLFTPDSEAMTVWHKAVQRSQHIVYVGDIYELLFIKKDKGADKKETVENAIAAGLLDLERQLKTHPDKFFHFVLGNHENLKDFRAGLDALARYPNFEWHPEAIKIGETIFTHGDLQKAKHGKNDTERPMSDIDDAAKAVKFTGTVAKLEDPATWVGKFYPNYTKRKNRADTVALITFTALAEAAQNGTEYNEDLASITSRNPDYKKLREKLEKHYAHKTLHYREGGSEHMLDKAAWKQILHIVSGHTHVPFTYHKMGAGSSKRFMHNTGAVTRGFSEEMGFIAAELRENGTLNDVVSYDDFQKKPDRATYAQQLVNSGYGHAAEAAFSR